MQFEIIGEIEHVETIAAGAGVRVRAVLNKVHGKYEAHGIGRRDFKIKAYADQP